MYSYRTLLALIASLGIVALSSALPTPSAGQMPLQSAGVSIGFGIGGGSYRGYGYGYSGYGGYGYNPGYYYSSSPYYYYPYASNYSYPYYNTYTPGYYYYQPYNYRPGWGGYGHFHGGHRHHHR